MEYVTKAVTGADAADWITVAAYLLAAGMSWHAARWAYLRRERRPRLFWTGSAAALMFFGVNELLDLQMLLTDLARMHAQSNGWYEDRRPIQYAFVMALTVFGIMASLATMLFVRRMASSIKLAVVGYVFIGIFVLFRASSFHKLEQWLGSGYQAFNFGSIQEMAGIVVVAIASLLYVKGK